MSETAQPKKISRRKFLYAGLGAAAAVVVGAVAAYYATKLAGPAPPGRGGYRWANENLYLGDEFLITLDRAAMYYALDNGDTLISLDPHLSVEAQNRDIRYLVLGAKVDGIMISPLSEEANVEAIEWAIDQGVPVVCYNTDVKSRKVPISILVSNEKFGEAVGDAVGSLMKKDGVTPKEKDYVIVVGCGTPMDPWVPKRNGE
jgi:ABC-type sugar transport system substrate-binding protein